MKRVEQWGLNNLSNPAPHVLHIGTCKATLSPCYHIRSKCILSWFLSTGNHLPHLSQDASCCSLIHGNLLVFHSSVKILPDEAVEHPLAKGNRYWIQSSNHTDPVLIILFLYICSFSLFLCLVSCIFAKSNIRLL